MRENLLRLGGRGLPGLRTHHSLPEPVARQRRQAAHQAANNGRDYHQRPAGAAQRYQLRYAVGEAATVLPVLPRRQQQPAQPDASEARQKCPAPGTAQRGTGKKRHRRNNPPGQQKLGPEGQQQNGQKQKQVAGHSYWAELPKAKGKMY